MSSMKKSRISKVYKSKYNDKHQDDIHETRFSDEDIKKIKQYLKYLENTLNIIADWKAQ